MARLRKFKAYRKIERPYTRISKYKTKNFVRGNPHITIQRFETGNPRGTFEMKLVLVSEQDVQIRHNAMESARQTSNKVLEEKVGKGLYYMKYRIYPFHILRENPLASGAGADRMSTGMAHSFGKAISKAAQVFKGTIIMEVNLDRKDIKTGKLALKKASYKLPCKCKITEAIQ